MMFKEKMIFFSIAVMILAVFTEALPYIYLKSDIMTNRNEQKNDPLLNESNIPIGGSMEPPSLSINEWSKDIFHDRSNIYNSWFKLTGITEFENALGLRPNTSVVNQQGHLITGDLANPLGEAPRVARGATKKQTMKVRGGRPGAKELARKAEKKVHGEEVEQVDEISRKTAMKAYAKAATARYRQHDGSNTRDTGDVEDPVYKRRAGRLKNKIQKKFGDKTAKDAEKLAKLPPTKPGHDTSELEKRSKRAKGRKEMEKSDRTGRKTHVVKDKLKLRSPGTKIDPKSGKVNKKDAEWLKNQMKGNIDKIRFANKHRQRNYGEEVEQFDIKSFVKDLKEKALEWGSDESANKYKKMTPGQTPNTNTEIDEAGARDHFRKFQSKFKSLPAIDSKEYPEIRGLEGPFRFRKDGVLYYDPKEGKYYDNKRDMYIDKLPESLDIK